MPGSDSVLEPLEGMRETAKADATGDAVAHIRLIKQIDQLRLAAETPIEKTTRMRFQITENMSIRIALEYGVLQAIASKARHQITAAELSKELGIDELLVIRIMRMITFVGLCDEIDYATYAANESTEFIVQTGFTAAEKHHTDLGFGIGAKLIKMIRSQGLHQFPEGPGQKIPFEYAFGLPLFEFFQVDKEQKEAFGAYMSVRRGPNSPQWFDVFPVKQKILEDPVKNEEDVLIVDVGGGAGHEILNFKESFPEARGRLILEDLPQTIQALRTENTSGIELVKHDFFNEQPIKGAKWYYLRNVMHNWSDPHCSKILSQIVAAMDKEESRVLIDEYVLSDTGAERRAIAMDIWMMLFLAGIERSEHHWKALLDSVGLEIVGIWPSPTGLEAIIEAKIKA